MEVVLPEIGQDFAGRREQLLTSLTLARGVRTLHHDVQTMLGLVHHVSKDGSATADGVDGKLWAVVFVFVGRWVEDRPERGAVGL